MHDAVSVMLVLTAGLRLLALTVQAGRAGRMVSEAMNAVAVQAPGSPLTSVIDPEIE